MGAAAMMMSVDREAEGARDDLLALGSEMTGATVGAAAGLFLGGAAGALSGAALGPAAAQGLRWAIAEVGDRAPGRRGRQRAMGAAIYAGQRLEELLDQGAELRADGFFERQDDALKSSEALAEGVLLAAVNSFEERKVRHLGYLYANTAIDEGIDRHLASLALRRAEELTWRQYLLLAMVEAREEIGPPTGALTDDPGSWTSWGAMRELRDLFEDGYIHGGQQQTRQLGLPFPGQELEDLRLTTQGVLLHHLLSLQAIPRPDLRSVRDMLSKRA